MSLQDLILNAKKTKDEEVESKITQPSRTSGLQSLLERSSSLPNSKVEDVAKEKTPSPTDKFAGSEIYQTPKDNRKEDSVWARLGRVVLPQFLEKEFGIDESQRKTQQLSGADFVTYQGNLVTKKLMQENPEKVDPMEYFRRGLSFGNDLDIYQKTKDFITGQETGLSLEDLPDPATKQQKIAEAIGNVVTMTVAQPLIEAGAVNLITKIPGGTNLLNAIKTKSIVSPWTVGYGAEILKSAGTGGLFGLIQNNKKSVAENVIETAGLFAGFTAFAYPIFTFFKPIIASVGKMEVTPNLSKALNDPAVNQSQVSKTLWFKNPKDDSQLLKVTANGVQFVPKSSITASERAVGASNPATLTKLDIEAFQTKPSLYENLKSWIEGKVVKDKKIPFNVKDNGPQNVVTPASAPEATKKASEMTSSELRTEIETLLKQSKGVKANPIEVQKYQAQLGELQSALEQYHNVASDTAVFIKGDDNSTLAKIDTIEYSDGKFAVKITASTPSHGLNTDFNQSKLYATEKQAIAEAKREVENWAKDVQKRSGTEEDATAIESILNGLSGKKVKIDNSLKNLEPAELSDTELVVNTGDYVVDRDGNLSIVTSGNSEKSGDNIGYLRIKGLNDKQDHIFYANQIRLATDAELLSAGIKQNTQKKEVISTVNPSKRGIMEEYRPDQRAKASLGPNITTLDKTLGKQPNELIKIYRGADKNQKEIVAGDFVTTNKQLAKDYAGTGKILEKEVKLSEVLDDKTEPLGEEYIYRPKVETKKKRPEAKPVDKEEIEKLTAVLKSEYENLGDKAEEAISKIYLQMDLSEAGYRLMKGYGADREVTGVASTFPKWMPEEYRSKELFEKIMPNFSSIDTIKFPEGNRPAQREFYNLLLDNLDLELGIDTSEIRNNILKQYEKTPKEEVSDIVAESIERGESYTDEELEKLYSEYEKIAEKTDELLAYTGGADNADIGVFRDGTPIKLGSLDKIRPIEMPELVRLARELTGAAPKIREKMRDKLGYFKPAEGQIYLRADQFKQGNEAQLSKLLAHEIGHLVDWLPDKTMKRGNLLGRIFSLRKFMSSTFNKGTGENIDLSKLRNDALKQILAEKGIKYGDYITTKSIRESLKEDIKNRYNELVDETGAIKDSTIKAELSRVSEYWRPYDKVNSSPTYLKYRNKPNELYADAISMLFNSPGMLEEMAPNFYREFFGALDLKPEVKASYFELQELLNGTSEQLFSARKEDIRTGFAKAEAIQADFVNKKDLNKKALWERLRQQLDDVYYPILKKQREAEAKGVVFSDENSPKYLLQEQSYIDNENFLLVEDIDRNVVKPIEDAGMIIDDLGEYLLLNRIQNDRADIANPFGFNKENAGKQLEFLRQNVGEQNFELLKEKAQYFHDLVFKSVEEAVAVGSYNKELFETKIKPNKDTYASFQVVDYMQDYIPATVKGQVGTLKEVANPFISTILKTVALNRLNAYQRAKNGTIKLLTENFPEDISKTKRITTDGRLSVFKPARGKGSIEVLVDGKMDSYDVDPYIAESFTYDPIGNTNILVSLLDKFNNKLFKPVVTTYNLGFAAAFNPIRDFKRNYKIIPSATVGNLLKAYASSLPQSIKYAKGELDEFTRSLVESKAINAPVNDYNFDPREDELGRIMERYGLIKKDEPYTGAVAEAVRKTLLKPVAQVLEGIRFVANTFEIVSKIAGAKVRIAGGESGKGLAYNLRNFTGTPNYKVKGLQTQTTNAIFVFSNIMKEGLKSDYRIATDPNTRSGYWYKTVKMDLLPKLLMFLASAGAAGTVLKDFYDNVSEYDKTNYLIIPLGYYNDKAVYMRIPHDETGRLLSSAFWKMANSIKDGGDTKDLQDIFALGAGQLPSVTPAISLAIAWEQYLSGKNPYDNFRGRNVIDDTTFLAGGGASLKKMAQWTTNNLGFTKFATYDTSKNTGLETALQVTPWFSSLFKVSNYGQQEQLNEISQEAKQEGAKQTLKDRELIAKYVKQAREDKATIFAVSKYRKDLVMEALGGKLPENEEEKIYADNLVTKFKRSLKRGLNDDPRVSVIISATSNNQKLEVLKAIEEDMTAEEFKKFKQGLVEDQIVTPELLYRLKSL
jgi:hypothetical protein